MATYYVKSDGNNDNDGTTWALAKATLGGATGALSLIADGDEIQIGEGTYTGQISLTAALTDGKSVTIKPYTGNTNPVIFAPDETNYAVLTNNEACTGVATFENITFTAGTTSRNYPIYLLGEKSVTFRNCTMTGGAYNLIWAIAGTNTANRVLTITDCTVSAGASASKAIVAVVTGSVIVSGGTWAAKAGEGLVSVGGAMVTASVSGITGTGAPTSVVLNDTGTNLSAGAITIEDCTVPNISGTVCHLGTGAVTSVKIHDNVFAADAANAARLSDMLNDASMTAIDWISICRNTCTDFANGIWVYRRTNLDVRDNTLTITLDIGATGGYCLSFGVDDWVTVDPDNQDLDTLASRSYIVGNHVTVTGTGERHAALLGQQYAGVTFAHNYVKSRGCGTDDYGLVVKCQGATIVGNIIDAAAKGLYIAGGVGNCVMHNTILAQADFVVSIVTSTRTANGNTLLSNVFASEDATVKTLDWSTGNVTLQSLIDYNLWSHFRVRYNNTTYTTLAALVAAQATYVQQNGDAMHPHDVWTGPKPASPNYSGGGQTRTLGLPTAVDGLGTAGAIPKLKRIYRL